MVNDGPPMTAILYVAARLPTLSETFVYRELLGLRARGHEVIGASVHRPLPAEDPLLREIARTAFVVYAPATALALPVALLRHPLLAAGAVADAFRADHPSLSSRLKHIAQAAFGIATAWRLRGRGIGAVHAHMANVPAMIALYIARALGVPFSFTGHAADLFVQRAALSFKLREASFVSCISHWHRGFYRSITALDERRLPVVRCAVAITAAVAVERQEIVTVARLVAKKGIDLLIEAFHAARPAGWRLRILGDGPERARLEALVAALGLGDDVAFDGARPHAECLAAISTAGLFVLPCRTASNDDRDGIPVVLMEAMAAGRAVIAGDLPTIRELVSDGETGLLAPPDDAAALATLIARLTADPVARRRLGLAARAFVAEEFSDAVNLARLEAAFAAAGTPA